MYGIITMNSLILLMYNKSKIKFKNFLKREIFDGNLYKG
jgi:hypothetical protein